MATATALLQLKFKEFTHQGRTYIRAYRKRWVPKKHELASEDISFQKSTSQ